MRKSVIVICALLQACFAAGAQSLPILNATVDARSLATGSTQTPGAAQFVLEDNLSSVGFSYMSWAPSVSKTGVTSFDAGLKIWRIAAQFYADMYSSEPYEIVSEQGVSMGQFTPKNSLVGAGIAFAVTKNISVGANFKGISSNLAKDISASSFATDIVAVYSGKDVELSAGAYNIGKGLDYGYGSNNLPSLARVDARYSLPFGLGLCAEGAYLFNGGIMAGAGVEYEIAKMIDLRAGYHYGDDNAIPSYAALGAAFKIAGISLDFSYLLASENLAGTLMFGLRYSF